MLIYRFFGVAAVTIGLSLLPFILFFIMTFAYHTDPAKHISAAERLMQHSCDIDISDYISDGGSAMVVDNELNVTPLGGDPIWDKAEFTETEWTDFLYDISETSGYQYDIAYRSGSDGYWLIMRMPVSVKVTLGLYFNPEAAHFTKDIIIFSLIFSVYFAAVAAFVIHYSKRTANDMKAREQLLHSEEEKRMLLVSEISHDLKTPLASVQGYSEMLLTKDIDTHKQREYLQSIYDNSVRSNNILRSLFTYSKLGSSGYRLNTERTDICEYARQLIAGYIPIFEDKGFGYDISVPDTEIYVDIDHELFRRVFDNILENSMKYNIPGTDIGINIEFENMSAEITISDNGTGIPAEHIDKIFQPFFRADRNMSNSDGSGLGLAIVKQIITLHGGDISYIGGSGCKWLIRLPANR